MKIVLYILFGLFALAHLYFCVPPQKHVLRRYTKPLLMPLLIGCYALSVETPSIFPVLAVALCCIGDTLTILPDRTMFLKAGYTAFAGAALCYAVSFLMQLGSRPTFLFLAAAVVIYAALLVLFLYRYSVMLPPGGAPFFCVCSCCAALMSLAACLFAFTNATLAPKLVFAGSLFFLASGATLASQIFYKRIRFGNFLVMLTYLIGQALMVFGYIGAVGA